MQLRLTDGTEVSLHHRMRLGAPDGSLHYAPFNLRLAERQGEKQFSFLAYRQDSTAEIMGGILHFLLTWGPTAEQRSELDGLIQARSDSSYRLGDNVPVQPLAEAPELEIGPADDSLAQLLRRGINGRSLPPLNAGQKMATSFSFSGEDARLLAEKITDPTAWETVWLRIRLAPDGAAFAPALPPVFVLTKNFAECLQSL